MNKLLLLAIAFKLTAGMAGANESSAKDLENNSDTQPFQVGVCVHFIHFPVERYPWFYGLVKAGNFSSLRDELPWDDIETPPGVYKIPEKYERIVTLAHENGVEPLIILNCGNQAYDGGGYPVTPKTLEAYTRYCEFVVKHFAGRVKLFEMWNEWEEGTGMVTWGHGKGKSEDYARLLRYVYPRLKKINPDAVFLGQTVVPIPPDFVLNKGWEKSVDGVAVHWYVHSFPGKKGTPEGWRDQIRKISDALTAQNNGVPMPIYLTEIGWPNNAGNLGVNLNVGATYTARALLECRTIPTVKALWWYDFMDDGTKIEDPESNFGLLKNDGTPKPAYYALRDVSATVKNDEFLGEGTCSSPDVQILKFRQPSGVDTWALWSTAIDQDIHISLGKDSASAGKLTALKLGAGIETPLIWQSGSNNAKNNSSWQNLTLTGMPLLISGDLAGVNVRYLNNQPVAGTLRTPVSARSFIALAPISSAADNAGWQEFGGAQNWRPLINTQPYGGVQDLDARFKLHCASGSLTLTVEVQDDKHFVPDVPPDQLWQGDSVQFAIQSPEALAQGSGDFSQYTMALSSDRKSILCRDNSEKGLPTGQIENAHVSVTQKGSLTVYQVQIPADQLGIDSFRPSHAFGFSILVNDNDGDGRKGYLQWSSGIGLAKSTAEFGLAIVTP
jgi:hypothetical protein